MFINWLVFSTITVIFNISKKIEKIAKKYGAEVPFLRPKRLSRESVGIQDVLSKSQGSSNPHNVVKATFNALFQLRDANKVALERGISLEKVFNG